MVHRICVCLLKTDISLLFAWWQDAVCWLRGVTDDDVEFVSAAVAMSPWQQWCKYAAHKRCRRQQWCWWDAAKVIPNLHIFCLLASSPPTTDSLLASSPPTTDSLLATSPPTTDSAVFFLITFVAVYITLLLCDVCCIFVTQNVREVKSASYLCAFVTTKSLVISLVI